MRNLVAVLMAAAAILALVCATAATPSSLLWDSRDPQGQLMQQFVPQCPKNCTAWCTEKYNKSFGICNRSIGLCSCALP